MTFNHFKDWELQAKLYSFSVENGGDGRFYAVEDGIEKGSWDPKYGGCGFGWLEHPMDSQEGHR